MSTNQEWVEHIQALAREEPFPNSSPRGIQAPANRSRAAAVQSRVPILAVHVEDQLSLFQPIMTIADGFPGAVVPDDHGAGAVLLGRDGDLETA
ncbi:hypothetical protein [Variovorax sp. M-6]|uniref:hypothetical protein n=1 Tax=Variovorax sp. M-6 TaxID=3233041 RepID=UPI003F963260